MLYTNEEITMLKTNTKQIEEYLRGLIPNVRENISVPFGKIVTRGRYGEVREPNFELIVTKDGVWGWAGCLRYEFDESKVRNGRTYVYAHPDYMEELTANWFNIKCHINTAIQQQESRISAIKNFQL